MSSETHSRSSIRFLSFIVVGVVVAFMLLICVGVVFSDGKMYQHSSMVKDDQGCENFGQWSEIASPFEGERCFRFFAGESAGVVCKPREAVKLKECAKGVQP